jgi:hypothetical protein
MLHRHEIEGREALEIAQILTSAYEAHCAKQPSAK